MKKLIIIVLMSVLIFTACNSETLENSEETVMSVSSEVTPTVITSVSETQTVTKSAVPIIPDKWTEKIEQMRKEQEISEFITPSFCTVGEYTVLAYDRLGNGVPPVYCIMSDQTLIILSEVGYFMDPEIWISDGYLYMYDTISVLGFNHISFAIYNIATGENAGECLALYDIGCPEQLYKFTSTIPQISTVDDIKPYMDALCADWVILKT